MATTPNTISRRIDAAIDSLNAKWDLGLPKLHGAEADRAEKGLVAERCSNLIRFLYYKTDNIDALFADFTEKVRQMQSEWVFKPSQERGTLPVLPQTKSLVERDFQIKRKAGLVQLSDSQRLRLQEALFNILDENSRLARLTNSFSTEQGSTASFTTAPSTPQKRAVARPPETAVRSGRRIVKASETVVRETASLMANEPELKHPMTRSTKRTLAGPDGQNKRKSRQQTTMSQFLQPKSEPHQTPPLPSSSRSLEPTSFETAPSPEVSLVFSSAGDDEMPGSNDTSMLSTQADNTQDLLPTQDANDLDQDEDFQRSFNEACHQTTAIDAADLLRSTAFKVQAWLPPETPFWYCWEVHRLAQLIELKPIDLYQKIHRGEKKAEYSTERLWDTVKTARQEKDLRTLLQKSNLPTWVTQENKYLDPKTNKVVYQTAILEWSDDASRGPPQLRLNALHLEQSCRLHRRFGADRFIVLSAPALDRIPRNVKGLERRGNMSLTETISNFFAIEGLFIAGRYWRVCFAEEEKSGRTKKVSRSKYYLFAETGFDTIPRPITQLGLPDCPVDCRGHQEIKALEVAQWHLLIQSNSHSGDLKLFSRWSLGFSKTTPTIELHQSEFLHLPDEPGRPVMNDGCALMSLSLARAIWATYGGKDEPPSAVQGRVAGAKGLWLVDYNDKYPGMGQRGYWIEVSDSQLKIKPHPRDRVDADASQTTFEVLRYPREASESRLNMQLITILEDRGVPRKVLQDAVISDLEAYSKTLKDSMQNRQALRTWLQQHGRCPRSEAGELLGSFPSNRTEQMKWLLECGFNPQECPKLIDNAYGLLDRHLAWYMKKLWVTLPQSTLVYCAPDPLGVLAEDEVYIGFSRPVLNPVNGRSDTTLEDVEVLVARNPAYLPSDIQRRKAVYKADLRHYKDVIIFPTKGTVPLASLLSGGDYDGDLCQVIWDPEFVKPFQGIEVPKTPKQKECSLIQRSQPIGDIFRTDRPSQDAFCDFLRACVAFNACSGHLGICTTEYNKLVYRLSQERVANKLLHPGVVKLATLAGYLVDSRKQGWNLSNDAWGKLCLEVSGPTVLDDPAFKADQAPQKISGIYPNVIDFLKFEVAKVLKQEALTDFNKLRSNETVLKYDRSLSQCWHYFYSPIEKHQQQTRQLESRRAWNTRSEKSSAQIMSEPVVADLEALVEILEGSDGLRQQVTELKKLWQSLAPPPSSDPTPTEPRNSEDSKAFCHAVQTVADKYRAIKPKNISHEIRRRFEEEKDWPISDWSLLRASCLHYFMCRRGDFPKWVWYVAGRELCFLKAYRHTDGIRPVVSVIHDLYKVDTKYARALLANDATQKTVGEAADDEADSSDDDEYVELD